MLLQDWCDPSDAAAAFAKHGAALSLDPQSSAGCPNWQSPASQPVGINRETIGWNAAAACFAYGYGMLALQGYKYVGAGETPRSLRVQLCRTGVELSTGWCLCRSADRRHVAR